MRQGLVQPSGVEGVLLDLGGVVYVGGTPIAGAIEAVERLRRAGLQVRFITNTTRRPRRQVIADLRQMGLEVDEGELLTPALMARAYLEKHDLSPFLIIHPALEEDFLGLEAGPSEAVVVGDAGQSFSYDRLNSAFRKITEGARLLALAMNRNFKDADGELSLDAGPFVVALEYATRQKAVLLGKPSAEFFETAVESLGFEKSRVLMIGDDAEMDVAGAIGAGLQGMLVRTGKYRAGDEREWDLEAASLADDLGEAVERILSGRGAG